MIGDILYLLFSFGLHICWEFNCFPLRKLSEVGPWREGKITSSLGKLLSLLRAKVWEGACCGRPRSNSAGSWCRKGLRSCREQVAWLQEGQKERATHTGQKELPRAQRRLSRAYCSSEWVGSPALYRRTQWVCAGERVELQLLLLPLFPPKYFEIYIWRELIVSIPVGLDILEFKKCLVVFGMLNLGECLSTFTWRFLV